MGDTAETERRASDQIRYAVCESVVGRRCVVRAGDLTSPPIPWFAFRAGETVIWSPPSIGEQGLLLCPEGEIQLGLFLPGIESTAFPLPGEGPELIRFKDGAQVSYDAATHVLTASLPEGGRFDVVADQVNFSGDIVVSGISFLGHRHSDVEPGAGVSGDPQ